jgi:hypothetical protein
VCKNGISQDELIPIYTRDDNLDAVHVIGTENPVQGNDGDEPIPVPSGALIPPRPQARRRNPTPNQNAIGGGNDSWTGNNMYNIHNGNNLAGFGLAPPVFFQALTTSCDIEIKDPLVHTISPYSVTLNKFLLNSLVFLLFATIILI